MTFVWRIRRFFRHFGILIARIIVFFVLLIVFGATTVFVIFKVMVTPEGLKSVIASQLQEVFHRPVQISDVTIVLYQGVRVRDLRILEAPGYPGREFIYSDIVVAKYRWRALLHRRFEINEVQLVNPRIQLIRKEDGTWNVGDIFVSSAAPTSSPASAPLGGAAFLPVSLSADVISIDHGDIAIADLLRDKNYAFHDVGLRIKGFDLHDPFSVNASFESSMNLGGPWPVHGRISFTGSMSLADFHWEDSSFTADKLVISADNESLSGSASIWNFRHPEITSHLTFPKLSSAFLMRYGKIPPGIVIPPSRWRLHLTVPDAKHYQLKSLEGSSGPLKISASGLLDASQYPPHFQLAVAVPATSLNQMNDFWHGWDKYQLSGIATSHVGLSGTLAGASSVVYVDKLYIKLHDFKGLFFGDQRLSQVDAEIRGSKNLDTISLAVDRGTAFVYQNALSNLDLTINVVDRNLKLDHLNLTWNAAHIKLKGNVKNLSKPKEVVLDGAVDKINLNETVAAITAVVKQINPDSLNKPRTGPWSRIFKYSIPKTFPATSGRLRIGELGNPNFDNFNLQVLWDLHGISTGLKRITGNIRVGFGPGRVLDIPALEKDNNIMRVVFLPFVFMHRLNNLTVISAATADPKSLDFNRIYADYGMKNGVVDVHVFHVDSSQLLAYADGNVDFPREKINLHMLTRMTHARGSLPEYLTDEKGRPSIGFFVEGDLNKPSLRIDYHKMEKDAIEKAVEQGRRRSKAVFPNFSASK